ncbi:MAG: 4Fe-4S dicluster domain-containing protein [Bdellovibrionales bacterium]|nr:4Fe-4S dicluster domain-containing protein [Bdellovibrionales bacterium]
MMFSGMRAVVGGATGLFRYLRRRSARFKPVVERYPDKISGKTPEDMFPRMKGYLSNDLMKCTGCGDCLALCPVRALQMEAVPRKDGSLSVEAFSIDLGKCFSCSICVDNCPVGSLAHTREYELVATSRSGMIVKLQGQEKNPEQVQQRIRTYEFRW